MIEPSIGVNPIMPGWPGFVSATPYGVLSQVTAPTTEPLTVSEIKKHLRLVNTDGEPAPTAPTLTLVTAAGNVTAGAHRLLWTFVTADGETDAGGISNAVTADVSHAQISATVPIGGASVTARKGYMTAAGGTTYLLALTVSDNTTATATINIADGSLGAQAPTVNTTLDPELVALGTAGREWAERETGRAFLPQTWTLYLDSFPWWRAPILLPKPPLQTITSIKYYDQDGVLQTWGSSNYIVLAPAGPTAQRGQIVPASGVSYPLLPSFALTQRRPDAVQVQFVCGLASAALVPQAVKSAIKLLIGNLWLNREAGQIVRGSSDVLPFGVDALLAPYRVEVY